MVSKAVGLELQGNGIMSAKNEDGENRVGNFERHLQAGISLIVVALLTWAGWSLNQLQQNAAAMTVEVGYIKSEMRVIKEQNQEIYTKSDSIVDWSRNAAEITEIKRRLRDLEAKTK